MHIVAVLCIINQKGLGTKCRKLTKAVERRSGMLKNLLKAVGSQDIVLTNIDVQACKVEISRPNRCSKIFRRLMTRQSPRRTSNWGTSCPVMHSPNGIASAARCTSVTRGWAGVNGQVTKGRHPQMWMSFRICLKLHKLTVFSADAAERQRFYIQQAVHKPQRATVRQHILQIGVLNDYVKHLPTLKDNPKAVPMTKKENIPFSKADLAVIVLASVPMSWQNQYNLNHSTVPESTRTLLQTLRPLNKSWLRSTARDSRQRVRAVQPNPKPRVPWSTRPTGQVPKKGCSEKFCQRCKAHSGPYQTHNTLDCRCYDSNGKPLEAAAGKPSESKKPYRKSGGNKSTAFMQSMFKAYAKS